MPSPPATTHSDKARKATSKKSKDKHGVTEHGHRFCHYPSPDPFVKIHALLDIEFGRYSDGGKHASEVILPGHEIAFRYDFALLPWKVFIESDDPFHVAVIWRVCIGEEFWQIGAERNGA